jgi:ABC-type dipeptide/oligopeptide/nickel transport system permease component
MTTFIIRRILIALPVLWAVLTLVFFSIHLVPGDPVSVMLFGHGTKQDIIRLRHELGLDQPLWTQYVSFMRGAIHFDFGNSITTQQPVAHEIWERLPYTAELAGSAFVLAVIFGLASGILAALFNRTVLGTAITTFAVLGISIPDFFLGTLLALLFGVYLGWLPVAGTQGFASLVLPSVSLALGLAAIETRLIRASMVDILGLDYVRTAKAKGVRWIVVVVRHVLRNALIPVVTILGLTLAYLLGGAAIIEIVFARPGLGTLAINAASARDFPVVQGTTFFFAVVLITANLLVDILYGFLDPRIRYA